VSFVAEFNRLPHADLLARARSASRLDVETSLTRLRPGLIDFAHLISPAAAACLESMGRAAHALTQQRFGRVIRLFAPLYLSNECINRCRYCGFSRNHPIRRVTLSIAEVTAEARALRAQGFRNLLLVAGEHPRLVSTRYLERCVAAVHAEVPGISLEIGPLKAEAYQPLVQAGAEGLVVYQETYDRGVYAEVHGPGPKRDFEWRLETPERAYAAGFRRLGIGALLGLADWRSEAIALAAHAVYLLRHCWQASLTVSVPRLRPCAGAFQPPAVMGDRDLVQLVCALRIFLPDVGLVLSTREPARLRDGLIPLGITLISAGSHTEPGGYTGAGHNALRGTEPGCGVMLGAPDCLWTGAERQATPQFQVADNRSPAQVSQRLRQLGYEPVWKDWDTALTGAPCSPSDTSTSPP